MIGYGGRLGGDCARGLYLLDGPGNDMVAVTNLAAAGCQLILFTTGHSSWRACSDRQNLVESGLFRKKIGRIYSTPHL